YFKNNQKEGQEKVWDDSGKEVIQVATYKAGKREGEFFKSLYSAGYYTCTYKNDKMNGVYTEYYPTKKVKVKGQYKDNNKEGQWIVYNSFEQTVQKLTYKNDKLVEDILILKTMDKDMEVSQNDIAMVRPTGKQTQVITTKGNKIACMQDIEGILEYLNGEKFYRMDEKAKIYVNIDVMRGLDANGVLKTSVDLGVKITPDKDGVEIVKTLFRED
ncbi:MAG: hypothetical protein HUK18_04905, partial [Bacteroidales bacterium]|nr:hypothetical protein [Bacteroidales bacterium]